MKSNYSKIFITLVAVVLPVFILTMPHFAYASCGFIGTGSSVVDCLFVGTSWIAELAFAAAGAFLTLTGVLLNGTMVATLNMSQIVNATSAIGTAWRTIRDFSSIFIIFLLLYASIKMILGMKDAGLGNLIKNIIIAGLLINFSLFITKFLIDTSNIVSLSFYNAIAPGQNVAAPSGSAAGAVVGMVSTAFNDGGISNVFMQSLDIQKIVSSPAFSSASSSGSDPNVNRTITLAYVGGTILMVTAAFSFLFAAVAFAVRLGVLILLMAFSPIYFIGMIVERTKPYAKKWLDTLLAMCIFMPVYLLLMYVAMSVINDPNFFNFAKVTSIASASGTSNSIISPQLVGIVLQYIIAFLFINAPMVAAIKIGSEGVDYAVKWGQGVKKWSQGFVGQHTVGRASKAISDSETFGKFARQAPNLATIIDKNVLSKGSGASFGGSKGGYDARFKKYSESRAKLAGKAVSSTSPEKYMAQTEAMRGDLEDKQKLFELAEIDTKASGISVDDRNRAIEKARKAEMERDEAAAKFAARKTTKEDIEKELKKGAKEEYAKNLEGGALTNTVFFATKKARKDAADKIRKDMKKSKKDKAIDDLISGIKEESKGSDDSGGETEKGDGGKPKK